MITILFYPWNEEKQEYETDPTKAIPLTFGEMTTEYYNRIITGNYPTTPHEEAKGFHTDNVIRAGTNLFSLADGSLRMDSDFGVLPTDFTDSEDHRRRHTSKFKIKEGLTAELIEDFTIFNKKSGTATINMSFYVRFILTGGSNFNIYGFMDSRILENCNYNDFMSLNDGYNVSVWYARQGNRLELNSYPYHSDNVIESTTTTGCLIHYMRYMVSTLGYGAQITQSDIRGIDGSIVHPKPISDNDKKYVIEILSSAIEIDFPDSDEFIYPGDYNNSSDEGDIPPLPMQSAIASGMVRMYQMTTGQLNQFANFLWNAELFSDWEALINTLKQWFENPLDSIISLTISPVDIFHDYKTNTTSAPEPSNIKLTTIDTGVQGLLCPTNYKQISLGKLNLKPYFRSFLDCNPHTRFSLYLPYLGFKDIDSDVLFSSGGTTLEVVYNIDVMTGVCVANILVEKESNGTKLKHILYSFAGNMNTTIPISSSDMKNFLNATFSAIASGVAIASTGGAATPLVAGALATQQALNVASQKVNVAHSGGMSLEAGMFGCQYAYLVVTRPREARPTHYKEINGIPSEIGGTLSQYSGFTQVSSVHITIDGATDEEKNEIETLLKAGVIL